ncbi:PD-(D/E)XK nuclease family protein [Metabacillus fastidiosus]|uniref:PD-(D/E)XK nuclease family protein n=1 Tax=Metabacillus fastidiosus TaxID=1458 RepID=UPI003D2C5E5E
MVKPLFNRIYDLLKSKETHQLEDYLTEIFSPILLNRKWFSLFLNQFLQGYYDESQLFSIQVFTQRTYNKLATHTVDSRPDIVISFTYNNKKHLLFIENKIGSAEGVNQLSRYADHLREHRKNGYYTHLIYITKYYDPKEEDILDNFKGSGFTQIRWYQIYNWLLQFKADLYCSQVLEYMEELQLNKSRKFTPIDIYAIQNAQRLQSMLDEALDGKVSAKFSELFGKPKQWSHRTTQLRDNNLYILINDQSDWKFIGCGFEFTEEEYPLLTVFIEVHPNCGDKEETKKVIQNFCGDTADWNFNQPSDENDYFYGYCAKSLVYFLSNDDHIDSIQEYLIAKLEELHILKINNKQLKWI